MIGYAIWIVKCTKYLHNVNEPSVQTLHWEVCGDVL